MNRAARQVKQRTYGTRTARRDQRGEKAVGKRAIGYGGRQGRAVTEGELVSANKRTLVGINVVERSSNHTIRRCANKRRNGNRINVGQSIQNAPHGTLSAEPGNNGTPLAYSPGFPCRVSSFMFTFDENACATRPLGAQTRPAHGGADMDKDVVATLVLNDLHVDFMVDCRPGIINVFIRPTAGTRMGAGSRWRLGAIT